MIRFHTHFGINKTLWESDNSLLTQSRPDAGQSSYVEEEGYPKRLDRVREIKKKPNYSVSLVKKYLERMVAQDQDNASYFPDAVLVSFEEKILLPFAREGRLSELRDGLDDFYSDQDRDLSSEWEKNFYALYVLKELLSLSVAGIPGSRYSQSGMEERLEYVFYTEGIGKQRIVMNKTKLGVNLYLRVLVENGSPVALPDDALLEYLYKIGCRRAWIDALRKKIGGKEKP